MLYGKTESNFGVYHNFKSEHIEIIKDKELFDKTKFIPTLNYLLQQKDKFIQISTIINDHNQNFIKL